MLGVKQMFQKQTGGQLRKGFAIGAVLFAAWLVAIYFDRDQSLLGWIVRGFPLLLFVYCFYECLREVIRRRRKP
jgi:hypothetical protein